MSIIRRFSVVVPSLTRQSYSECESVHMISGMFSSDRRLRDLVQCCAERNRAVESANHSVQFTGEYAAGCPLTLGRILMDDIPFNLIIHPRDYEESVHRTRMEPIDFTPAPVGRRACSVRKRNPPAHYETCEPPHVP